MAIPGQIEVGTQTHDEEISSLCSSGVPPLIMTGIFVQMLRTKFADPDEIEHPSLRDNVWTPDIKTSKILIQPSYQFDETLLQARPAIFVRRQEINTRILAFNNQFSVGYDAENLDGATRHETLHGSGHILFCVGRTGAEAELLGTEVWKNFLHFGPIIREDLSLARFVPMQLSEVGKVEESTEHWATAVSIATFYYETWELVMEAPILKTIGITVTASV